jgi:hypothetical protein
MTSRERMLTAYQCKQPDRVPINVRGVRINDERWTRNRHPSYAPLIEMVAAHCDLMGGFGARQGWLLTASERVQIEQKSHDSPSWTYEETIAHTPKGPLSFVTRVSKHQYSSLTHKFWVEDDKDLERFLSVPYVPPKPDVSGYPAALERMGDRGLVMIGTMDPIAFVHELLGSELLGFWSIDRKKTIDMLVEIFTNRLLAWFDHLIENRIGSIFGFGGAEYVVPPLMHPRYFTDWVAGPMKKITERIHAAGGLVHVHCHGPLDRVLEQFAEMGSDVLHPIEAPPMGDVELADAKRRIGDRVCLEGNIQIGDLYAGEEDAVRDTVRRAIDAAAPGGGYVLCPTASPFTRVLSERVLRNYIAMIETGLECGKY